MKDNRIIIWFNGLTKSYGINLANEIESKEIKFDTQYDNILYIMEEDQLRIATKIKDRLNQASAHQPS